jgi:hypothetical protein
LVGHGKVHSRKITFGKPNTTQGNIIDFAIFKIAIKEVAVYKSNGLKSTIGKIAIAESAVFILFELKISVKEKFVFKFLVCDII